MSCLPSQVTEFARGCRLGVRVAMIPQHDISSNQRSNILHLCTVPTPPPAPSSTTNWPLIQEHSERSAEWLRSNRRVPMTTGCTDSVRSNTTRNIRLQLISSTFYLFISKLERLSLLRYTVLFLRGYSTKNTTIEKNSQQYINQIKTKQKQQRHPPNPNPLHQPP